MLEWPPAVFWSATPKELNAAMDGWNEKNGNRKVADRAMLGARLRELMEQYPDG